MFCHLHNHNEYSYLDGLGSAEDYLKRASRANQKYFALTNHGNIDGLIAFQKAAEKQKDVIPIFGLEGYIIDDLNKKDQPGHIIIFFKKESALKSILPLLSKANLEGFYKKPRFDFSSFRKMDLSEVIISTACTSSFIYLTGYERFLTDIRDNGAELVFEIMPHLWKQQAEHNKKIIELSKKFRGTLIATNDCHYVMKGDEKLQEVLLAIQRNTKWKDPNRWKFNIDSLYLKSELEMEESFKLQKAVDYHTYKKAIENTIYIAEKCSAFSFSKKEISLPILKKNHIAESRFLFRKCNSKIKELNLNDEYKKRLKKEFKIISSKNFSRYFLLVEKFLLDCKKQKIITGPGRGSVGGSLIAYLLDITKIDPIKYGLQFERFLNADRQDWPDIDIDVEKRKRQEAIEILNSNYYTAGISTLGRLKSRGILRDLQRIFELDYNITDSAAKAIIEKDYGDEPLEEAKKTKEEVRIFAEKYPEQWNYAVKLNGTIRNKGQHAAAVIVSDHDLESSSRCHLVNGNKGQKVINWDMESSDYQGLIKLDILGLATLSVINMTCELIKERINPTFDINKIPIDDKNVFDIINNDMPLTGIFQLSGKACSWVVKEIKLKNFNDIVSTLAIARTGPMQSGVTELFIERQIGKAKIEKVNPIFDEITKSTNGLIIYQEQLMSCISLLAGMTLIEADKIRKVIAKKRDVKELEQYKDKFINGCKNKKTLNMEQAESFWSDLQNWAGYGFNFSHSVEYALIAYQTAYLKALYPIEFLTAYLSYGEFNETHYDSNKHKQTIINEIVSLKCEVVPPKIGISKACEWVLLDNTIYAPFTEIKGIGEEIAFKCCEEKKSCGFFDISETKKLPPKVNELLSKCGSFFKDKTYPISALDILDFNPKPFDIQGKLISIKNINNDQKEELLDIYENIKKCQKCKLHQEAIGPITPKIIGKKNIIIVGDVPNKDDNRKNDIFCSSSSLLLFNELKSLGIKKEDFCLMNACRCYPSETKVISQTEISACNKWFKIEFKAINPCIALILGNNALSALKGKSQSGISKLNATTEFINNCWICYCIHPSAVLRDSTRREEFIKGLKNFYKTIKKVENDFPI